MGVFSHFRLFSSENPLRWLPIGYPCLLAIGLLALGFPAKAEGGYTNHAGNVIAGFPVAVKRAIDGAEKAMARSRKRAEKGLCTKEESEAFCAKSSAALKGYLDKQVESGTITSAERKAIGR